uniref:Pleiotropic regulator 1 n=1 Tax=Erpetoichthys calabaricus TaxID=27687 RepID=A0A8C4TJG8_ERPCA
MVEEVQKHSVHTLVFRSLKRTHDMFVADHAKSIAMDDKSHKLKMDAKLRADYFAVLHMPVIKEGKDKALHNATDPYGHDGFSTNPGMYLLIKCEEHSKRISETTDNTFLHRLPFDIGVQSLALALPPSQSRQEASRVAPSVSDILRHAGNAERSQPPGLSMAGGTKSSSLIAKKAPTMPKPQWHPPWKLYRVISGHLGWVRSIAVEPGNQWFVTGSADRTIKIWDLASGKLKLSLTGHISTVRGVAVSSRSPYLFSCGEDKQVKCWDLEYNKVIRHYHGHLSAVYDIDLHPTIDVLVTCSRDSTARVWDVRTKANVHTLSGHTNTVATVRCQSAEPQIITGKGLCNILGKPGVTLTNHKKSVRALALHPRLYTFASGSPDNIKQWKFPDGSFIQNLSGHNAIINTLAINSDGVLVVSTFLFLFILADNGTIHLWDWRTGYNYQKIHAAVQPGSLDSESGIFACVFDHSESRLITAEADKTIKVYKEDDTATEETHPVSWKPEIMKRKRF